MEKGKQERRKSTRGSVEAGTQWLQRKAMKYLLKNKLLPQS